MGGHRLFGAVPFGVTLAGGVEMVFGVLNMRSDDVGVMGGLFVVARFVMFGEFGVVLGGLWVVGGSVLVAFGCFLRHEMGV